VHPFPVLRAAAVAGHVDRDPVLLYRVRAFYLLLARNVKKIASLNVHGKWREKSHLTLFFFTIA
jgi:hypothetical protein